MSRAERRRQEKLQKKPVKTYTVTDRELAEIKNKIYKEIEKQLEDKWKAEIDEHALRSWTYFANTALLILHRDFGFGHQRAGKFADALAEMYNDDLDLLAIEKEVEEKLDLKFGIK